MTATLTIPVEALITDDEPTTSRLAGLRDRTHQFAGATSSGVRAAASAAVEAVRATPGAVRDVAGKVAGSISDRARRIQYRVAMFFLTRPALLRVASFILAVVGFTLGAAAGLTALFAVMVATAFISMLVMGELWVLGWIFLWFFVIPMAATGLAL